MYVLEYIGLSFREDREDREEETTTVLKKTCFQLGLRQWL